MRFEMYESMKTDHIVVFVLSENEVLAAVLLKLWSTPFGSGLGLVDRLLHSDALEEVQKLDGCFYCTARKYKWISTGSVDDGHTFRQDSPWRLVANDLGLVVGNMGSGSQCFFAMRL